MLQQCSPSLPNLLKEFGRQVKTFVREETQLAKTEMGEKFSEWSGDAAWLGVGGAVAYVGLIVLLIAFSMLAALGFQQLRIDPSLAMSAGFGAIGLFAVIVGAILLLKAIKVFSSESLTPERAIANLYKVRGEPVPIHHKLSEKEKELEPRSYDLEKKVMATEDRMGRAFEELERRVTFGGARRRFVEQIRLHPYRCGLWALFGGFAASFVVIRKFRI